MTETTISWSALRAHEECRQKSALLRGGHRSPAADLRGFFHGMVVDRAMRDWLADPDHPTGAMRRALDDTIDAEAAHATASGDGVVRWKHAADRTDMREFCAQLVDRLEPILRERVLPYPYAVAHRFRVPLNVPHIDGGTATVTLIGEMDLLVHYPDGDGIWDLKGTRDNTYFRKVIGQLVFYDVAHGAQTGRDPIVAGLIQPMCDEPVLPFDFDADARRNLLGRVLRMAADIWRQEQTCTTHTSRCSMCNVSHACARYAPEHGTTMPLQAPETLAAAMRAAGAKS